MQPDRLPYQPFNIDLSDELVARVDGLANRLAHLGLADDADANRELVIRMALLHGLEELEQLHPGGDDPTGA